LNVCIKKNGNNRVRGEYSGPKRGNVKKGKRPYLLLGKKKFRKKERLDLERGEEPPPQLISKKEGGREEPKERRTIFFLNGAKRAQGREGNDKGITERTSDKGEGNYRDEKKGGKGLHV